MAQHPNIPSDLALERVRSFAVIWAPFGTSPRWQWRVHTLELALRAANVALALLVSAGAVVLIAGAYAYSRAQQRLPS